MDKAHSSTHEVLLVGDGDFSFWACFAEAFGSATKIVATSLYSEEMVMRQYCGGASNLRELEELGGTIKHEVNAHSMNKHPFLNQKLFDRIVYNFPHTALKRSEAKIRQIESHRRLVKGFFVSACDMLEENGEAYLTYKTKDPYSKWETEKLAEEAGLCLVGKVSFRKSDYPGYEN